MAEIGDGKSNVVNEVKSMNDLERASTVLRSVDWVLPAYLPADGICRRRHFDDCRDA
jgi:hypothetical protein